MNPNKKRAIEKLSEMVKLTDTAIPQEHSIKELAERLVNTTEKESKAIIKDYIKQSATISRLIEENPGLANSEVEKALLIAATGGSYTDTEVAVSNGRKYVKRTTKHIPPNMEAIKMWLNNRAKEKWSDKPQPDIELEDLSEIEGELYGEN